MKIMPRCGSILQAGTCHILRLAENPRWSRVWQSKTGEFDTGYLLCIILDGQIPKDLYTKPKYPNDLGWMIFFSKEYWKPVPRRSRPNGCLEPAPPGEKMVGGVPDRH